MEEQPIWKRDKRHVHPSDAQSKFERWIRAQGGPTRVAKLLEIHAVTIGTWLSRRSTPSLPLAQKILDLSQGELTLDDILDGTRAW